MKLFKCNVIIISLFLFLILACSFDYKTYANEKPLTISVEYTTDNNNVVNRLVFNIKEMLKNSSSFNYNEKAKKKLILSINSMTMPDTNGNVAIYSVIWTLQANGRIYFDNVLGYCGSDRVQEVAEGIVAKTDMNFNWVQEIIDNKEKNTPKELL